MQTAEIENRINSSFEILARIKNLGDKNYSEKAEIIEKKLSELNVGIKNLEENNSLLTIGIVGQMKVGKSSFLNAFLFEGEAVLPKAATPMTAGLTVISYTEGEPRLEVEYYNPNEWNAIKQVALSVARLREELLQEDPMLAQNDKILEKKLEKAVGEKDYACYLVTKKLTPEAQARIGKQRDVVALKKGTSYEASLENFVGAKGAFTSVVKALYIYLNDERLKDLRVVDTPGVNDPVVTRDAKTMEFLREAHGVLMIMNAGEFMSATDINFMNNRIGKEGISCIVVIGNKIDHLCLSGEYRNGWKLGNALEDIKKNLEKRFESQVAYFNYPGAIKGLLFTSGIADSILQKFFKAEDEGIEVNDILEIPGLDHDEKHILKELSEVYKDDFSPENLAESLQLLSDSQTLYDDYIKKEFIARKNDIMGAKVSAFMLEHKKDIENSVKFAEEDIQNLLKILNHESIESLETQMSALNIILEKSVEKIQARIKKFIRSLHGNVSDAFEGVLSHHMPAFSEIDFPTTNFNVEYQRKGTGLGLKHKGFLSVSILDAYELCKEENKKVDACRKAVRSFWNNMFSEEREGLINFILNTITEMATKDNVNIDDSLMRNLVNEMVDSELTGKETLVLYKDCEEFKLNFKDIMNLDSYIDLATVFDAISQSDAENKIKKQASENLKNASKQVTLLNLGFFDQLQKTCLDQCEVIKNILENFSSSFKEKATQEINSLQQQLDKKLRSKKESVDKAEEALSLFHQVYQNFKTI